MVNSGLHSALLKTECHLFYTNSRLKTVRYNRFTPVFTLRIACPAFVAGVNADRHIPNSKIKSTDMAHRYLLIVCDFGLAKRFFTHNILDAAALDLTGQPCNYIKV